MEGLEAAPMAAEKNDHVEELVAPAESSSAAPAPRRSARARKPPAMHTRGGSSDGTDELAGPATELPPQTITTTTRRNPKRKATSAPSAALFQDLPENVLDEALAPMRAEDDEGAEWEGWCEVESEPVSLTSTSKRSCCFRCRGGRAG